MSFKVHSHQIGSIWGDKKRQLHFGSSINWCLGMSSIMNTGGNNEKCNLLVALRMAVSTYVGQTD